MLHFLKPTIIQRWRTSDEVFKRGVVLGREKGNFAVFGRKYWGMPGINIGLESHLGKTKTQVGVVKVKEQRVVIIDRFWWRGAGFKNEGRKFLGRRRQGFSQRWKGGMPAGFGGLGGWGVGGCQPCAPVVFQHASPIGNPSYLWPWVTTSWILESLGSLIKECRFIPYVFWRSPFSLCPYWSTLIAMSQEKKNNTQCWLLGNLTFVCQSPNLNLLSIRREMCSHRPTAYGP